LSKHGFYHNDSERREWQNPKKILYSIGLKPGLQFIDIGCGIGFFTIPAAKIVGNEGRVYALDINEEAIGVIKKLAEKEGLNNLTSRVGKAEKVTFCNYCADIVFFGINLHDFANPEKVLINAKKMLKSQGRLIVLDWKKESMEIGPPMDIRFDKQKAMDLIRETNFEIETIKNLKYHYLIIAKK
jgi:ubiquinone/menaquinone biosynthesis C-methylase UbiE